MRTLHRSTILDGKEPRSTHRAGGCRTRNSIADRGAGSRPRSIASPVPWLSGDAANRRSLLPHPRMFLSVSRCFGEMFARISLPEASGSVRVADEAGHEEQHLASRMVSQPRGGEKRE